MFPWIGAASGALSLLNTVLKSGTASGTAKTGDNLFSSLGQALTGKSGGEQASAVTGSGQGAPTLSSGTLSTLIAIQGQGGPNGKSAFARLDADGDGSISKNELETAAKKAGLDTSSADTVFGKLDSNGDGSVSQSELAKALGGHRHHPDGGKSGLAQLMNGTDAAGASTKTVNNADGSSTTTITYADGSTVSTTSTAGGASQANLFEKLIKMQAQIAGNSSSSASASTTA